MPEYQMTPAWDDYSYGRALNALGTAADPDIVLQQLGKPRHSLRVLETDDEISAALETRREAVLTTPWGLTGDDDERTEQTRQVIEHWIDDILRGAWNAAPYGFSVLRCAWSSSPSGKRLVPHPDFGIVAPVWIGEWPMERFSVDAGGRLKYARMDTGERVDAAAPEFFLTRRNATWRNPYGEALLSRLYWPWFFRYNGWRFWMQFIERFGDPILTGNVMSPQEFIEAAQKSGFASVMAVTPDEDIGLQAPNGQGEHQRLINELNRRIQKVILGQTLTTQVDGKGSYAAAKVHNEVRDDKRKADQRMISRTVQTVINWIWSLNQFGGKPPRFEFDGGVTLHTEQTQALRDLNDTGWRVSEQLLSRLFGDVRPGDFEPVAPSASSQQTAQRLQLAAGQDAGGFTPAQQLVEDLADHAAGMAPSPIAPEQIKAIIEQATSPEHLDELLADLVATEDPEQYRQILERALFAADVFGYAAAKNGEV